MPIPSELGKWNGPVCVVVEPSVLVATNTLVVIAGLRQKAIRVKAFGWADTDEGVANRLRVTIELTHNSNGKNYHWIPAGTDGFY